MKPMEKEKIRQAIRDDYGKIVRSANSASEKKSTEACCGEPAGSEKNETAGSCGCDKGITLDQMTTAIGYSQADLANVPEGANMGLGCGNPVALASLKPGETVVDLGSGGGFDCFLAAKEVGENGKVIGVDMTPDMISKSRGNAEKVGTAIVEFRLSEIEHLPIADSSADIIMSNCVINLSPDKPGVYREAFRVLKPGGRLSISDILTTATLPEVVRKDLALISACIGGAASIDDTVNMLKEVGFQEIRITPKDESRKMIDMWTPGENAGDYVVSATIEAVKS